ncbi:MAG: peptidoglycan DD-metalloendopeptidase family protein [bacterium]|nr:peptidoglycan DD-metalloendopeptidase family protein [bacterium]
MAIFLVLALFVATAFIINDKKSFDAGVFGGPTVQESSLSMVQMALAEVPRVVAGNNNQKDIFSGILDESYAGTSLYDGPGKIVASPLQGGVFVYKAQKGDNLSKIAAQYGISLQTLLGANPGLRERALQIGQEINILPISGILYKVQDGETPESIASRFSLTVNDLQDFNKNVNFNDFGSGLTLLIPGGKAVQSYVSSQKLPYIKDYFVKPAEGINWGKLHNYNAVDIANSCGAKVVAAADGLVVPDENLGDGSTGWNGGYGHFIFIEHPNGTKTRYAHLEGVSVSLGDYVHQGDPIGTIGNTGNTHGPTGCHLHFEVYGAQNPLTK